MSHPVARVMATFYLATTVLGAENSELLRPASVAVAVILCPAGTAWEGAKAKFARPSALVVTAFCPRTFLPSSPEGLE